MSDTPAAPSSAQTLADELREIADTIPRPQARRLEIIAARLAAASAPPEPLVEQFAEHVRHAIFVCIPDTPDANVYHVAAETAKRLAALATAAPPAQEAEDTRLLDWLERESWVRCINIQPKLPVGLRTTTSKHLHLNGEGFLRDETGSADFPDLRSALRARSLPAVEGNEAMKCAEAIRDLKGG